MDKADAQAVNRQIVGFGDDPGTDLARVKRGEPCVVIAHHDRQRAPLAPEVRQSLKAWIIGQLALGVPGPHPEIAQVADDHQAIGR